MEEKPRYIEDEIFEGATDAFSAAASGRGSYSFAAQEFLPDLRTKSWQPEVWSSKHDMIVVLTVYGKSVGEIAEELNLSPNYVSLMLSDPRAALVRQKISQNITDAMRDINDRFKLLAQEAVTELADEMRHSSHEKIRQTAAFGILDRAGYSPLKRISREQAPELPADMAKRIESALAEQETIEAEYEVEAPADDAWQATGTDG